MGNIFEWSNLFNLILETLSFNEKSLFKPKLIKMDYYKHAFWESGIVKAE